MARERREMKRRKRMRVRGQGVKKEEHEGRRRKKGIKRGRGRRKKTKTLMNRIRGKRLTILNICIRLRKSLYEMVQSNFIQIIHKCNKYERIQENYKEN